MSLDPRHRGNDEDEERKEEASVVASISTEGTVVVAASRGALLCHGRIMVNASAPLRTRARRRIQDVAAMLLDKKDLEEVEEVILPLMHGIVLNKSAAV